MRTVRRLYFYAVALISLEIVLWGLIGLIRSIVDETVGGGAEALAQALSLILVGVPIFLVHWLWAQRASAREEEEKTASLRAIFLYAILLSTLIPVVQNLLALIDRAFIESVKLEASRAFIGGVQTWQDNLIALFMNGVVAAYFWNVLRGDWPTLPNKENFTEVRRLYRYTWMLYSLLMVVFGVQQVLRFVFYIPSDVLGEIGRETFANGTALLLVGTPIWFYSWRVCQDALVEPAEKGSNLRLGVLYALALGGVITVLSAGGALLDVILRRLLGETMSAHDFIQQIGGPISIGVPLGAVWAYFGGWLGRHIESVAEGPRRAGMKRFYAYILSLPGLGAAFVGVASLISFVIDLLVGTDVVWGDVLRARLAAAIATMAVGLPLWLIVWRRAQAEALAEGDEGDHARRSVIRKAYLYLVLFAAVIGGMGTAVGLVFQLLRALLTGDVESNFLSNVLNLTQLLALFIILLVYHLSVLRRDGASAADALAAKQADFAVLVVDPGSGIGESMKAALAKYAPNIPVTVQSAPGKPRSQFQAIVLPGSLAVNAPDWLRSYKGTRLVVPNEAPGLIWAGVGRQAIGQAAQAIRQLAEGQEVHQQTSGSSAWMVVMYIAAGLFGLEMLFILLVLAISLIAD